MKTAIQLIALMVYLALGGPVQAGVSYWDGNDAAPGAGDTPIGTWGVDNYWSTDTNGAASTMSWTPGDTAVFSAGTDATNPFTVFVSGNQTANGLAFEEGAATLSGGTITLGVTPFRIVADVNATIDSVLAGPRGLTKTGAGTLTLNGTNTYTGLTAVSNGVLAINHVGALGSTLAGTTISTGAALEISGGVALTEPLTVFGTGVGGAGAVRNMSGSNWIKSIQLDTAVSQSGRINSDAGTLTLAQVNAGNKYELTIVGNGDVVVSGVEPTHGLYWGGLGGGLRKLDGGTLTIDGLVTIRGVLTLDYEATMKMGADHRFGNAGGDYPDLHVYGVWDLNGFSQIIDCLHGSGTITNNGTSTLVMGTNGTYTPYDTSVPIFWGSLHGNTTIKKVGPNTQIFNASLQYTGDTIIEGGTLELKTSCSNSPMIQVAAGAALQTLSAIPLTVVSNQTLMGSGTVTGRVAVAAGGRICPGDSVGKLTVSGFSYGSGGLDLSAGGTNVWELAANSENDPGTNFDQILMIRSPLVLGGASTLSIRFIGTATAPDSIYPFWQEPRTWNIISVTNVSGNFAAIENGIYPAGNFTTSVDASGVVLTFTPNVTRPRITTITGAGTGSVTVNYTNTLPGTSYILSYSTNLGTPDWFAASIKTAEGTSDSQTDSAVTNGQRFYRVYFFMP